MADVTYLNAGDDIGAAHWNDLFAEADRKVGAAMDNHSLVYGTGQFGMSMTGLWGSLFYFLGNYIPYTRRAFGFTTDNYNHDPFTTALAAASFDTALNPYFDVDRKVVRVTGGGGYDGSMEAHRKLFQPPQVPGQPRPPQELYWIWERNALQPQKMYQFAMAEMIVESYGALLTIEHNWTKYNFFRINNVQEVPLVVRFNSALGVVGFEYTVPKYESVCIRRTGVGGPYTVGYRYFHKFISGDPRHLSLGITKNPAAVASMQANNVCNPFVLREVVSRFTRGVDLSYPATETQVGGGPRLYMDAKVTQDAGDLWRNRFPLVSEADRPIGDFLYHKGRLGLTNDLTTPDVSEIDFQGFGTLSAVMTAAGITVGRDANGQLTLAHAGPRKWDVVPLSTNLLNRAGRAFGANISDAAYAIYGLAPNLIAPYDALPASRAVTWTDDTAGVHTVTLTDALPTKQQAVSTSWQIDRDSLTKVLQFNLIGNAAYLARNQDTDYGQYTHRQAVMTPWGLMLLADLELSLGYASGLLFLGNILQSTVFAGTWALMARPQIGGPDLWRLVVPVRLWFRDYVADPGLTGRFHTPRIGRVAEKYVTLGPPSTPLLFASVNVHGSSVGEIYGIDGADVAVPELKATEVFAGGREIQIWSSMAGVTGENGTTIGVVPPDESLYSAWKNWGALLWQSVRVFVVGGTVAVESRGVYWRLLLSVENYNCLAWLVNGIKYAYPLNWQDNGLLPIDATQRTGINFPANSSMMSPLRTRDCYYAAYNKFGSAIVDQRIASAILAGIPMYGFADLPDLATLTALTGKVKNRAAPAVSSSGVSPNAVSTLTGFVNVGGPNFTMDELLLYSDINPVNRTGLSWVKIGDVKAYAEAHGFKFIMEDFVNGLEYLESSAGWEDVTGVVRQPDAPSQVQPQATNFVMAVTAERVEDVKWVMNGEMVWAWSNTNNFQGPAFLSSSDYVLLADEAMEVGGLFLNWGAIGQPRSTWVFSKLLGVNRRILEQVVLGNNSGSGGTPQTHYAARRHFDSGRFEGRRLLFRNFNSAGLPRNSKVLLIPLSWARCKAEGFAVDGASKAALAINGANGYPLEDRSVPATGAEGSVVPVCVAAQEQFVDAPGGTGVVAWRVVHFRDCLIRL